MYRTVYREGTKGDNWLYDYSMNGSIDKENKYGQLGDLPFMGNE